jgi:AcrR family transcriptional regulator
VRVHALRTLAKRGIQASMGAMYEMAVAERTKMTVGRRFQSRARREADKEALKTRILDAARTELAAGTLETISIQKIADSIGYSKGTILKYYPTKILLLLAVKQQNLEAAAAKLELIRSQTKDAEHRLRKVMEAYIAYWSDNPDHFRSLYSMAGTIEDRRFPDGTYFGESEIARKSFDIFVRTVKEFLLHFGANPAPGLSQRLASALLSSAHGVIALPLGTPTMRLPDTRTTGRLVINNIVDAWCARLKAARTEESWPKVSLATFVE